MRNYPLLRTAGLVLLFVLPASRHADVDGPPYEPHDALHTFEIADGFQIELFAAEPLISDPVDIEVDEDGRIYVVEMPGYPLNTGGSGRVKVLSDIDGDGFPDTSTLFASGFTLPTGVMRWKEGILVTDSPHVWYLVDENGDDIADRREIVLTGFALSNPQHNLNNPVYGLDNGIYLAHEGVTRTETYTEQFGDQGDQVRIPGNTSAPVLERNASGRNVRFRPDTGELEALSGWSQFGHSFDAFGRHFLVSNAQHQFHEALAARYLRRNPALPIREALDFTPDHGNAAEVFPITLSPEHQLLTDRGVFTSASGITNYLGGAFPSPYDSVAFVAESVHNLVHADVVKPNGATFEAKRLFEGREFLASTDSWFRPVNLYVGPDGALYVVDYYRKIIEHPEWMDEETIKSGRLYEGSTRGRIYRISPSDAAASKWVGRLNLGEQTSAELVDHLEDSNGWWRLHAQRLLVDRALGGDADSGVVQKLEKLLREGPSDASRVHALWTLQGMGQLEAEQIRTALKDQSAGVRENALRLAEVHGAKNFEHELLKLTADADPRVRFQLMLTLGDLESDAARDARISLLKRDLGDEWVQLAALTAEPSPSVATLRKAAGELREAEGASAYIVRLAALIGGTGSSAEIDSALQMALSTNETWRVDVLNGIAAGLRRRPGAQNVRPLPVKLVAEVFQSDDAAFRAAALELLRLGGTLTESEARRAIDEVSEEGDPVRRADMLRIVEIAGAGPYQRQIEDIIRQRPDPLIETAAIRAYGRIPGNTTSRFLLEQWTRLSREAREAALDALLTEPGRVLTLLSTIEEGEITPEALGWNRRVRLMRDTEGEVQTRARALLQVSDASREEILREYEPAVTGDGDAARGRGVYMAACARCHTFGGSGSNFGPDLGTVTHWSPRALLDAILVPERFVSLGFEQWLVQRRDGTELTGILGSETATAITLSLEGGNELTIPRAEVASATMLSGSAMPGGLESQITVQQMSDLLAFLKKGN